MLGWPEGGTLFHTLQEGGCIFQCAARGGLIYFPECVWKFPKHPPGNKQPLPYRIRPSSVVWLTWSSWQQSVIWPGWEKPIIWSGWKKPIIWPGWEKSIIWLIWVSIWKELSLWSVGKVVWFWSVPEACWSSEVLSYSEKQVETLLSFSGMI